MVQRVHGVPQDQLRQGHQPTEVQEVALEVEALIEVRGAIPEAANPIGVLRQEVATLVLQEVEVLVQGVVEATKVLVVVPEVQAAVQEVQAALQDHHQVVDHLVEDHLQVEVAEDNNSQS